MCNNNFNKRFKITFQTTKFNSRDTLRRCLAKCKCQPPNLAFFIFFLLLLLFSFCFVGKKAKYNRKFNIQNMCNDEILKGVNDELVYMFYY